MLVSWYFDRLRVYTITKITVRAKYKCMLYKSAHNLEAFGLQGPTAYLVVPVDLTSILRYSAGQRTPLFPGITYQE